jgi:hypothetical protein
VIAGFWTHQQIVSDAFTFVDLMDIHEAIDVKLRNEQAVQDYMAKKAR